MSREFWKSAGLHLTKVDDAGWLMVTPDYLRAYYTRPEMHPVDGSCAREVALHEALMDDPFLPVKPDMLREFADRDAHETYSIVIGFRDVLVNAGSIEAAYLQLVSPPRISPAETSPAETLPVLTVPPVFLDQMVHLILRHILRDVSDPMQLRAAELFFREQNVASDEARLLLADEEIVAMKSAQGAAATTPLEQTGLGQLLASSGLTAGAAKPGATIELDVLGDDNSELYWQRSENFDMVVDFRFQQPAPDAFARVIEAWLAHMMALTVEVQPKARIDENDWRWHIGLDREANDFLNALYKGRTLPEDDLARIVGLFELDIKDERRVMTQVKGHPVYLGLAMTAQRKVKMKPQNLLMNLPLAARE